MSTYGPPEWCGDHRLSVRTTNVLWAAGVKTAEDCRALSDVEILKTKNAGKRTLAELRARGLRPDSCRDGCVLSRGHEGDCVNFDSPYSHAVPAIARGMSGPMTEYAIRNGHDIGSMLLWSLRYALGRRSTAPGSVAQCIQRYWHLSDDAHRGYLFRDLVQEVRRAWHGCMPEVLGDECDRWTWIHLLWWMRDRLPDWEDRVRRGR